MNFIKHSKRTHLDGDWESPKLPFVESFHGSASNAKSSPCSSRLLPLLLLLLLLSPYEEVPRSASRRLHAANHSL